MMLLSMVVVVLAIVSLGGGRRRRVGLGPRRCAVVRAVARRISAGPLLGLGRSLSLRLVHLLSLSLLLGLKRLTDADADAGIVVVHLQHRLRVGVHRVGRRRTPLMPPR